jgi:iron complex outermembrane receptor protein
MGLDPDNGLQVADGTPGTLKKLSLEQLMDLDVTSVSKQPEPFGQAPAAIQVVTQEEIRDSGASSIPEALRLADNLDIAQASSSSWNISARGFNAGLTNKLLVLMDGRVLYTPLYSGVFWNAQDYLLRDLDRIEVISGPGGTLWGANAVNGVINIISKGAKETQGLYLEAGGGSWLQDFAALRYGGRLGSKAYFRVYGKYFDRGREVDAAGNSVPDAWRMGQGGFRIDDESDPKDRFTLQGDLYDSGVNLPAGGNENFAGGNVLGRWSHATGDDSGLSLQLYYDRTYLNDPIPSSVYGPAGNFIDGLDTYDLDLEHHFSLDGVNRVSWGLGYRFTHDVVQNVASLAFLPTPLDHSLFSGFVQDEFHFAEKWSLTLGTKVEHNDYTGYEFEPSGRLAWTPVERQTLWAAVSRAVRVPSRIDRDFIIPNSATPLLVGVPTYGSEYVVAYELGYRAQLATEISTALSTFFNNYDHLRSLSPTGTGTPYFFANDLLGQTYGFELTVDCQVTEGWRLHAGYDLLQEDIWIAPGQSDANNGNGDTADPANQVFFRSSMDLPGDLELNAGGRWVDSRTVASGTALGTVPSYLELDAHAAWHPAKRIEIFVTGSNLLQDHHPEYGFPTPAREEIVRSVSGGVKCEF